MKERRKIMIRRKIKWRKEKRKRDKNKELSVVNAGKRKEKQRKE